MIRIANAQGFWGDRTYAACELLEQDPDLDILTMDYLAEVSLSIMAIQQDKNPDLGYAQDFVEVVKGLIPYWKGGGRCRLIANAGGLNPQACAEACWKQLQEEGCAKEIATISGDSVYKNLSKHPHHPLFCNLDTERPLTEVADSLVTANAYIGAAPVVEALQLGADIIITGRVADPSLVVAAAAAHYGWGEEDYQQLAAATVAGHLLECGTQVTGGIASHWLTIDDKAELGYPIAEIAPDGSCVITKPEKSGGIVDCRTVKEQLVYEIGDPSCYLSPDCTVDFRNVTVSEEAPNRISVTGAVGSSPSSTYKVNACYRDGWRSEALLLIVGDQAEAKARRAATVVRDRLAKRGALPNRFAFEVLGVGDSVGDAMPKATGVREVVLRLAVADHNQEALNAFSREVAPLVTGGPPGTTLYASGRPKPRPIFGFWPCLIERMAVHSEVALYQPEEVTQ